MPECPGCGALKCLCCPECDGTGSTPAPVDYDETPFMEDCDVCDGTGLDSEPGAT